MNMKHASLVLLTILPIMLVGMVASTVVLSPSESPKGDINTSAGGYREQWFDSRWHNRLFLNISTNSLVHKSGQVVSYRVNLDDVTDLDTNSLRLVYDGKEVPMDYDVITKKITFVVPIIMGNKENKRFALYYDTISNGVKPTADYDPSWVQDAAEVLADPDAAVDEKRDEFFAEHSIVNEDGNYMYEGRHVSQDVNGDWHFDDGTPLPTSGYIVEVVGDPFMGIPSTITYHFVDATGTIYEVVYNTETSQWVYRDSGLPVGNGNVFSKVYTYGEDEVIYNPTLAQWKYMDGGILETYALYDPAATFTFDTITYTGLFLLYNSTPFMIAIFEDDMNMLWVWDDSIAGYRMAHSYEIIDQTIYDGTYFETSALDAITISSSLSVKSRDVKNVEATAVFEGEFKHGGNNHKETITAKAYRGSPDVIVNLRNDAPLLKINPSGKIFFNLGGIIDIDGTPIGIDDFDEWLKGEILDLGISDLDIMDMYNDLASNYEEFVDSSSRIAVLTSGGSFNIDNLDFNTDIRVKDMTIATGNNIAKKLLDGGAITVKVIPMSIVSDYVALYDLVTHQGFGIKFEEAVNTMVNMLVEVWEATTPTDVYNYVTIGLNYLGWDWDYINGIYKTVEEYAGYTDAAFDAIIAYLNTIDPTALLDEIFTTKYGLTTEQLNSDPSIPLDITVISPLPGTKLKTGDDLVINITVTGETLADAKYYVKLDADSSHPTYVSFDRWNEFWTGTPSNYHKAKQMMKQAKYDWAHDVNIVIVAWDTNGNALLAEAPLIIDGVVQNLVWTITLILGGSIFGLLGIAMIANKKKIGNKVIPVRPDCIDGKCDL